ncbi:MAG: hypothetical protein GXP17_02790 [Gammaproteobacteria bacterium]|nr:hypothetical protein [Gammaproteobacteria bacterium]
MNSLNSEQQGQVSSAEPPALSPAKPKTGFGVAPSPFNGVKLELGIILVLGVVLWLGANSIIASLGGQLLMLAAYGIVATLWLMFRTRRVLRQCVAQGKADRSEANQRKTS